MRTITALFDSMDAAEKAAYDLATRIGGVRGEVYGSSRSSELSSLRLPGEDMALLHESVQRGGAVLHADVPDEKFQIVADALESAGAVDFDEHEAALKGAGWSSSSAATMTSTTNATAATATTPAMGAAATSAPAAGTAATSSRSTTAGTGTEEVIPVVEEQLRVGKRETEHGRVRIRSYVVETPVQEQVTLHQERVNVERRPVDRPIQAGDDALFRERTIEATETAEEAVISKEARVKEEVVIRKETEEHTETVRDTVRRTEVEVDDERGRTGSVSRNARGPNKV
jgi:uncharacterized protein (TIGR02271 family)